MTAPLGNWNGPGPCWICGQTTTRLTVCQDCHDRNGLAYCAGYIDGYAGIDRDNPNAAPAYLAGVAAGAQAATPPPLAGIIPAANAAADYLESAAAILRNHHSAAPEYQRVAQMLRQTLDAVAVLADAADATAAAPE